MIVPNQKVKTKWNAKNKKHYESKGYIYTGLGTEFEVDINDLPENSKVKIELICDYCGEKFNKGYINYLNEKKQNVIKKDCCQKCRPLKLRERYGTLNEEDCKEDYRNEQNTINKYDKNFLINEFWRYYEEFGVYPKLADFNSNPNYPSASAYNRIWGNWNNFLNDIGVLGKNGWYKVDEEVLIKIYSDENKKLCDINNKLMIPRSYNEIQKKAEELGLKLRDFYIKRNYDLSKENIINSSLQGIKDLYNDFGKCPTISEYEKYAKLNRLLRRKTLETKLNKKYTEICKDILNENNKEVKTKEQLLKELIDLKEKLGRTPLANELSLYGLSEKKTYMRKFGMTYQELILSLGWELSTPKLNSKSEDELLDDYLNLYYKLGRLPLMQDIENDPNMASYSTYKYHFGDLKTIWELLEIDYEKFIKDHSLGSGFTCIDKNGDICRSESEMIITNILIDSNIKYEKEKMYSELINDCYKTWKMDWYLPEYDIVVEYFGLYQKTQLNRNNRLGKYARKTKKKIDFCLKNNVKLIDLYYDDLKNDFQGLINKFKKFDIQLSI